MLAARRHVTDLTEEQDDAMSPTNIFTPVSTPAESIFGLSVFVFSIVAVIFVVVFALLAYVVVRFRNQRSYGAEPPQIYGSTQLIFPTENAGGFLAWLTSVPTLALFIAAIGAVAANRGGILQYYATIVLGLGLLYCASRQIILRTRIAARKLLQATIVYLPLQFLILIFRKG
jgi:hypothetical protein